MLLDSSSVVWKRTVLRYVGPCVCAGEDEEIGRKVDVEFAEEVEEYGGSSEAGEGDMSEEEKGEFRKGRREEEEEVLA
jgi:hypothetical protein